MDPITLQVMVGALRAACEEMGVVLVRSAHSANIKERRDASTGIFDAEGEMAMQAEHIPVHLGAMPAAVEAIRAEDPREGDAWIVNDPYRGGTHLPDITVVSPIHAGGELAGYAASRAHHADVGGRIPGSMPADSRTLDEEGVVIEPTRLVRRGELDREALEAIVRRMRGPRMPDTIRSSAARSSSPPRTSRVGAITTPSSSSVRESAGMLPGVRPPTSA